MLQTLPYFAISTHVLFSISISVGFIKISPDTINSTLTLLEILLPTVPFVEQAPINVQFVCRSSGFFFSPDNEVINSGSLSYFKKTLKRKLIRKCD